MDTLRLGIEGALPVPGPEDIVAPHQHVHAVDGYVAQYQQPCSTCL